ncbi:alpha/beta fold hydrolase [Streptomyces sp. NPDC097619]|uniref:alpha/beta fold hydrolase n=1 Tax=Streptomyces sp. NPDC097619 TaxID=3157228 RepID=UPI00331EEBA9
MTATVPSRRRPARILLPAVLALAALVTPGPAAAPSAAPTPAGTTSGAQAGPSVTDSPAGAHLTGTHRAGTRQPGAPAPGRLLAVRRLSGSVPAGAQGWQLTFTTRTTTGQPTTGSAFVLAPARPPAGERPVILWTHGTTGLARRCEPSVSADLTHKTAAVPQALARGWVLVAPDYRGPDGATPVPYLLGPGEAYVALDAARAARAFTGLRLSADTVVWGYSQGGHAALWTARLARSYAPVLRIRGVAALAPVTALPAQVDDWRTEPIERVLVSYALLAYGRTYPEVRVEDHVRADAREKVRAVASGCISDPAEAARMADTLRGPEVFTRAPSTGALGTRLREHTATAATGGAPVLVAQGGGDGVVRPDATRAWARAECAAGRRLELREYPEVTHGGLLVDSSGVPAALTEWTEARLRGAPPTPTC